MDDEFGGVWIVGNVGGVGRRRNDVRVPRTSGTWERAPVAQGAEQQRDGFSENEAFVQTDEVELDKFAQADLTW